MRRRLILAAASAALLLAGPLTAQSGPYDVQVNRGTAALVALIQGDVFRGVPLADGSEGFVFLFEREKSQVQGNLILPEPNPKADPVLPADYVGCIGVISSAGFDFGCEVQPPAYIQTDPALNETAISFTVLSGRPDGFRLSATMVLSGTGEPVPVESHGVELSPEPPERPVFAFAEGLAYFGRDAIARGSIRSDLAGGGAIRSSTTPNSSMIRGVFDFGGIGNQGIEVRSGITAEMEAEHIACFPEPEPGEPPSPIPPGCYPF